MIAPMIEAIKPTGSPSVYQPAARPMYPATKDPATPSSMVTMIPPGSFPGIKSFATAPTIRPMISITRIDMDILFLGGLTE